MANITMRAPKTASYWKNFSKKLKDVENKRLCAALKKALGEYSARLAKHDLLDL